MAELQAWYYLNTNTLVIKNARSQLAGGGILNGLVGTAQVMDRNLVPVANGGPVPVDYVPASQGEYRAVFSPSVAVPVGQFVKVLVLLSGGVNLTYRGVVEARVVENS